MSPEERAAAVLSSRGFARVRAVPPAPGRRTADLVAEKGGERWAVEVRTASRPLRPDASFEPKDARPLPYPTLAEYFAVCWAEKRAQLEATLRAERCARGLLLVAVEGEPSAQWERALRLAWSAAGRPRAVSFGLAEPASGALLIVPEERPA